MRFALGIEYDGSNYCGWQRQSHVNSIQQSLEHALSKVADEPIEVVCAGRTDTGVHATEQVVHFDTNKVRKQVAWTLGVNTYLPRDIAVKWCQPVSESFHARFSALARRYRYIISNLDYRPAILANGLTHIHYPLNHELMHQAAQILVGEYDFTSFRTVHCQAKTATRTIKHIQVTRFGHFICVDIQANAFLHHMVRNIVGTLLVVGRGLKPISWVEDVRNAQDRAVAGVTAEPNGLYLVKAIYPDEFMLPNSPLGPVFLNDI